MVKHFILFVVLVTGLLSAVQEDSEGEYKVLCMTRHSMRGVMFFNGQEILLPNDIILPNPFYSWNEDVTQAGCDLVNAKAINACVQAGLRELRLGKWNKHWEEIRVNFLYQGTFLTGKVLKDKLKDPNIKLTAVIDKEHPDRIYSFNSDNYDSVTFNMTAGSFPTNVPPFPSLIDPTVLQTKTRSFLNELSSSLHKGPFTGDLPEVFIKGFMNPFYQSNIFVATDLILMSAFSKPPLCQIFKNDDSYGNQRRLVNSASDWQSYFVTNYYSTLFTVYASFPMIEYFQAMSLNNKGKILVTENSRQVQLLKSLNIDVPLEIFPCQSLVLIQSKDEVCIMFTAPKLSKQGIFSKRSFTVKLIWKGSLEEWEAKVQHMYNYVDPLYPLYPVKEASELYIYRK